MNLSSSRSIFVFTGCLTVEGNDMHKYACLEGLARQVTKTVAFEENKMVAAIKVWGLVKRIVV